MNVSDSLPVAAILVAPEPKYLRPAAFATVLSVAVEVAPGALAVEAPVAVVASPWIVIC